MCVLRLIISFSVCHCVFMQFFNINLLPLFLLESLYMLCVLCQVWRASVNSGLNCCLSRLKLLRQKQVFASFCQFKL